MQKSETAIQTESNSGRNRLIKMGTGTIIQTCWEWAIASHGMLLILL